MGRVKRTRFEYTASAAYSIEFAPAPFLLLRDATPRILYIHTYIHTYNNSLDAALALPKPHWRQGLPEARPGVLPISQSLGTYLPVPGRCLATKCCASSIWREFIANRKRSLPGGSGIGFHDWVFLHLVSVPVRTTQVNGYKVVPRTALTQALDHVHCRLDSAGTEWRWDRWTGRHMSRWAQQPGLPTYLGTYLLSGYLLTEY